MKSGIVLGCFTLMLVSFLVYITSLWVAEVGHRAIQYIENSPSISNINWGKTRRYRKKVKKDKATNEDSGDESSNIKIGNEFQYASIADIMTSAEKVHVRGRSNTLQSSPDSTLSSTAKNQNRVS